MWQPSGHLMPLMRLPMMAEVFFVAVRDDFDGFRRAAPDGVDGNDVAAPDVGEYRAGW
ncbi:Uncharacterised protein [Neisseria gonorrhoeae]|nr:Uncharacterised protein [Neisseria gonorrhoeae]